MTIALYPVDLPCWTVLDSYTESSPDSRRKQAVDAGPALMTRRAAFVRPLAFAVVLTANQKARFDRFWDIDLAGGTRIFVKSHPFYHRRRLSADGVPLSLTSGEPLVISDYRLMQFAEEPDFHRISVSRLRAQLSVVILPD